MEEIDLTHYKFSPENEFYLLSVVEGIRENYPLVELDKELGESGNSLEDLTNPEFIVSFMKRLNEKYPD